MNSISSNSPLLSSVSVSSSDSLPSNSLPIMTLTTATAAAPKKRCVAAGCTKKLGLTDFDCRCGQRFCASHRGAEDHACTYDWKASGKQILQKNLTSCMNEKLERV